MSKPEAPRPDTINRLRSDADLAFAMLAAMQLGLFTQLQAGAQTIQSLATVLGVNADKLAPLVYALLAAGLLQIENEAIANAAEAQEFLVAGKPSYMGGVASNLAFRWESLLSTAESIKTGIPQAKLNFADDDAVALERFIRGLLAEATNNGRKLAELRDFSKVRHVADVGGGGGGVALALTAAVPYLRATVVDLPNVIEIARKVITESGTAARIDTAHADLLAGPLHGAFDVVVARALFQVFSRADAATVAKNISHALTPGGSIYVIGRMIDNSRLAPLSSVGFNLLVVNIFEAGGAYTEGEYVEWLSAAGFTDFEFEPLGGGITLLSARKPNRE